MTCKDRSGFTLIEILIAVAIIGILAAVATPAYMNYISKSRVVADVFPGLHSIENQIALYYAANRQMPGNTHLDTMIADANTHYFTVDLSGGVLNITIVNDPVDNKFKVLNGYTFTAIPNTSSDTIISWDVTGSLAEKLGLD